jgi:GntR family transcriptional regulator
MFRIEPRSAIPVYEQLKRQVRLAIASGTLSPGDRLSSIRELSIQLKINPNTVAKAYRQLETEGFLEIRTGSGAYVCGDRELIGRDRRAIEVILVDDFMAKMAGLGVGPDDLTELIRKRSAEGGQNDPDE